MALVAILSNPGSTTNRRIMPRLRQFVSSRSNIFHVEIGSFDDMPNALDMIVRAEPAMLVVNGGDGTIQATLSALINEKPFGGTPPPVAVLSGGKTNMIAGDLGMGKSLEADLGRLLEIAGSGRIEEHVVKRTLIGLDAGDGRPPTYGMFFGAAGVVSAILFCRRHIYPLRLPNLLSHIAALIVIFGGTLLGPNSRFSPVRTEPMHIHMRGGGILDGRFFIVMATTLRSLIMGFDPFAPAAEGKIKFSAVEHRRMAIFRSFLAMLTGSFGKKTVPGGHVRSIDLIRIQTPEMVTLDGEMFQAAEGRQITLEAEHSLSFVSLET